MNNKAEVTAGKYIVFAVMISVALIGGSAFYTSLASEYSVTASSWANENITSDMESLSTNLTQYADNQDTHQVNALVLTFTSIYDGIKLLLNVPKLLYNIAYTIMFNALGIPPYIINAIIVIPLLMALLIFGYFVGARLL